MRLPKAHPLIDKEDNNTAPPNNQMQNCHELIRVGECLFSIERKVNCKFGMSRYNERRKYKRKIE